MNQKQFSRRNLFTANFRSPYSALFDRLNPPYSANAQVLAPESETIPPSAGPWGPRVPTVSLYVPVYCRIWPGTNHREVLG